MPCPVCTALNRQHDHECTAEANATIRRRSERTDTSTEDQLDDAVLISRKRQAHIAYELFQHRVKEHSIFGAVKITFC
jgi:hypothetical protein